MFGLLGFQETETSITAKLSRGTFAASFFLACLVVLEMENIEPKIFCSPAWWMRHRTTASRVEAILSVKPCWAVRLLNRCGSVCADRERWPWQQYGAARLLSNSPVCRGLTSTQPCGRLLFDSRRHRDWDELDESLLANSCRGAQLFRRVIALPIMFSTVTVAMHLAPFLAREVNRPMLLGIPPWAFGVMSLLGLLCIFVIIYANRLRVSLLPSITLSCEPERGGLVQTRVAQIARDGQVLAQTSMATSIRVAVRAVTRIAPKNATAFVTKFEKLDTTGTWMASRYSELVQLPWVGETMTVDLSNCFRGLSAFCILATTTRSDFG